MNRTTIIKHTIFKLRIHLFIKAIFLTILLISCNSAVDKTQIPSAQVKIDSIPAVIAQNDSLDALVKSIIKIAANDFYKNQQPLPKSFRNVQIKYSIKPDKEILYILCGQFTTQDLQKNVEWTHFTTIKNSNYEQWIGPNGLTYCENSKEIPYTKTDLSIELKNKLNSLQKIEE